VTSFISSSVLISVSGSANADSADAQLIDLGHQFALLASQIDFAIEHKIDPSWDLLTQLGDTQDQILRHEARTTAGLFAKAQTVCWGRLGDLDPLNDMNGSDKMMLSIIRDLVRLHNPNLEHPGALAKLIEC
jgi:hypothetical protein